jgi:hypothetical protein
MFFSVFYGRYLVQLPAYKNLIIFREGGIGPCEGCSQQCINDLLLLHCAVGIYRVIIGALNSFYIN